MKRQKDKKRNMLLTAFERLAAWMLSALEYMTNSGSWKRWFKTLLTMGAVVWKGEKHG